MKLNSTTINLIAITSVFMTLYGIFISIEEKNIFGIIIMCSGIILLYIALRLKKKIE